MQVQILSLALFISMSITENAKRLFEEANDFYHIAFYRSNKKEKVLFAELKLEEARNWWWNCLREEAATNPDEKLV
jgi:hypothetical protein